jgi:hypothetical protein
MKKQPRRRASSTPDVPPPGLQYAFRLIDIDGFAQDAREVYPHAVKIIENMNHQDGRPRGPVIEDELMAAARAIFPPQPHDETAGPDANPVVASVGGFYVGVAVCWLLMTQINGGAR